MPRARRAPAPAWCPRRSRRSACGPRARRRPSGARARTATGRSPRAAPRSGAGPTPRGRPRRRARPTRSLMLAMTSSRRGAPSTTPFWTSTTTTAVFGRSGKVVIGGSLDDGLPSESTKGSLTPHGSGRGPPLPSRGVSAPRDVVVVLLDSLNRHLLGSYGGTEFDTPNLDRLAARSVRFTNHHTGSLPCMPARHDLLVGALDFPWRPWGSIEVWEDAVTHLLRRDAGISTMLVSDHPHLFETGGENYHTDFGAWDYLRGPRGRPVAHPARPVVDRGARAPRPPAARGSTATTRSRTWFTDEADFPGPRTMAGGRPLARPRAAAPSEAPRSGRCSWSTSSTRTSPSTCRSRGPAATTPTGRASGIIWPPYAREPGAVRASPTARACTCAAQYGAKLSMIDHWLGRILDVVDRAPGVGHHGLHPLHRPRPLPRRARLLGQAPGAGAPRARPHPAARLVARRGARPPTAPSPPPSTCTPRSATCSRVTPEHRTHGQSLVPLLEGTATSIREWALCGVWGREVHVADATRTFAKAPVDGNRPLSMFSNRWTTMPIRALRATGCPSRTSGRGSTTLPGSDVPVIRQPFDPSDDLPFWAGGRFDGDLLYDRREADATGEVRNQAGGDQRQGDGRPPRGGAALDRGAHRAARPAGPVLSSMPAPGVAPLRSPSAGASRRPAKPARLRPS